MHDGFSTETRHGLGPWALAGAAVLSLVMAGAGRAADPKPPAKPAPAPAADATAAPATESPPDARDTAVRQAATDYAAAFNSRDFAALAEHWTRDAELVEGEGRLVGRANIVGSIKAWLERHPQAQLSIDVTGVECPAATLARVAGRMTFTSRPGARPVVSRFVSLRVLEDGVWRIAESAVVPSQAAVLEELEWLVGTWEHDGGRCGDDIEVTFSRPLGESCIVGRTTIKRWGGDDFKREVLQVIHADRATGLVRTWIFDSNGARAEGVIEADGASYHQSLVGTPAESAEGRVARWVQVIAPAGEGRFTLHAIDRSIDGVALPEGTPLEFRKVR